MVAQEPELGQEFVFPMPTPSVLKLSTVLGMIWRLKTILGYLVQCHIALMGLSIVLGKQNPDECKPLSNKYGKALPRRGARWLRGLITAPCSGGPRFKIPHTAFFFQRNLKVICEYARGTESMIINNA